MVNLHEIAAHLAGHPKKLVHHAGPMAGAVGISTVAGVGTYQINSHIAKKQGTVTPTINPISGTSEGLNVSAATDTVKQRYNKRHKGGN